LREIGDHSHLNCFVDGLDLSRRRARVTKVVLGREHKAIAGRRQKIAQNPQGKPQVGDRTHAPFTGLALSGGGIRSASVGLGALQAIDACHGIEGIDYLSTVSGGGYIGCSLTTGLHKCDGRFPFQDASYGDTVSVRHIRDYSKYLIPHGLPDIVTGLAIFFRGLLANIVLLLPLLFLAVWATLISHPTFQSLEEPSVFGFDLSKIFGAGKGEHLWGLRGFWLTCLLLVIDAVALILWAFLKSLTTSALWHRAMSDTSAEKVAAAERDGDRSAELNGPIPTIMKGLFLLTAVVAFFELQPFILRQMDQIDFSAGARQGQGLLDKALGLFLTWSPKLAPLAGVVAFFSKYLGDMQRIAERSPTLASHLKSLAAKGAWLFVGLIIPSLIWWIYLQLSFNSLAQADGGASALLDWLRESSASLDPGALRDWLLSRLGEPGDLEPRDRGGQTIETSLYAAGFFIFGFAALLINPNATTFFRLYRDRLNKAFIFDPDPKHRDSYGDLHAISLKLHRIDLDDCPYPIINAALNLEGSRFANKRGRNADFFMFSPEYVGSPATGYIGSKRLFLQEPDLDIGTAMAISGAAFSPNMGRATVKALTPTLALLNARLGYWMLNPREVSKRARPSLIGDIVDGVKRSFFLLFEIFGQIDENSTNVYLTDGGNLENLGLYELLRRQCEVIIVVDSECDPTLDFPSLISLTRFARTDLGVMIDLPWEAIRRSATEIDGAFLSAATNSQISVPKRNGPHCAVCDIDYAADKKGLLFYFKASLSGDESDLVFDYKRRNPAFPHETTADQFFGEDQLEAYRNLGFHMVWGVLSGTSPFVIRARSDETEQQAQRRAFNALVAALGGVPQAKEKLYSGA
jgi:hypothetical protein